MIPTEITDKLIGEWEGTNLLRLSWIDPPDHYSPTRMSIAPEGRDKFLTLRYTWSHDDIPQEGVILLCYDEALKVATAAFADSWHMSAKILYCEGSINEDGVIDFKGFYEAPPDPDWGWRTTISLNSAGKLQMVMHNCSPDGVEDLAVRAEYSRRD
ncbi:MAG: DUF1579 family protein [Acidobacteriota bacterium]